MFMNGNLSHIFLVFWLITQYLCDKLLKIWQIYSQLTWVMATDSDKWRSCSRRLNQKMIKIVLFIKNNLHLNMKCLLLSISDCFFVTRMQCAQSKSCVCHSPGTIKKPRFTRMSEYLLSDFFWLNEWWRFWIAVYFWQIKVAADRSMERTAFSCGWGYNKHKWYCFHVLFFISGEFRVICLMSVISVGWHCSYMHVTQASNC